MKNKVHDSKAQLTILVALAILSLAVLDAQEMLGGKPIRTGIWRGQQTEFVEGEVSIILQPGVKLDDVQPLLQGYGATIKRNFDKLGCGLIELPESVGALSVAAGLMRNPLIEAAEPNFIDRLHFEPNDEHYQDGSQWALKNWGQSPPGGTNDADIDAPEAWDFTKGSSSTIIAILDTGIPLDDNGNLSHPDLNDSNRYILGPDVTWQQDIVKDENGHGTHVTGIAAAETNNSTGVAGVCGECKVMVIQTANLLGVSTPNAFYLGVMYAVDNGANVINYSAGGRDTSAVRELAVQYAYENSVVLVASAGNNCGSWVSYPAAYSSSYSNVIAVSATNHNDVIAEYSNIGPEINVAAPGGHGKTDYCQTLEVYYDADDIYSTTPNYYPFKIHDFHPEVSKNYGYLAGTSMAAPHVSGLAGLILSLAPNAEPSQVRHIIEDKADDKGDEGRDDYYGYGRINAGAALQVVSQPPAAPQNLQLSGGFLEHPTLTWDANTEPDLYRYYIYRLATKPPTYALLGSTTNITFTDNDVWIGLPDIYYTYYVKARDISGQYSTSSNTASVWGIFKRIPPAQETPELPKSFALHSPYPNPFNPATTIEYDLPEASRMRLVIYDIMGREVMNWEGVEEAGYQQLVWDGKDYSGRIVPAGIYIYRLTAASVGSGERFTASRKMVLMK